MPPGETAVEHFLRPGTLQLGAPPPLSLYVHLPWCLRKCPYCDFNSHEVVASGRGTLATVQAPGSRPAQPVTEPMRALDPALERRYLDALRADLEQSLPLVWGRRIHSVFIGGGTPSLFSPEGVDRLLADVRALLPLEPGCEVT
ncbi:MAG: oxygen-independent coproporphyrinogen III oxidase-like protein, partial [Rhodoferax sp.]|nr:oxygen-independent coproporphyrinogen III oxidase-like protein [Rhodoferax sp.]